MRDVIFKIHQGNMSFCCWENSCCSCGILEVPISIIPIQPMLEVLEGSGMSRRIVISEGGFHPLGCVG
jgi:hypothetical protein